ncbi:type I inositol polyphosphate 5-phosphatase 5 [Juglans microcarpa x Juglans regia]|uniref:type I inositol polyphosphate 5-phosphatase 5 n=1 Tax=Juglans microcarpa x Juglans regia TaxID=2249226 RepID=UPI001B7ED14F|nr:type I inositol polyphosphate 5-phosphatase 5 [Juglans microcarpa x Juglans regia]
MGSSPLGSRSFTGIECPNLSTLEDSSMAPATVQLQDIRIFVATWNVGGKTPNNGLNLEELLQVEGASDIYILGFQEIVPLSAGNVLVIKDNEPAAKWLALINQALNRPQHDSIYSSSYLGPNSIVSDNIPKDSKAPSSLHFFQKPSLKVLSRNLRADKNLIKNCNCPVDLHSREKWRPDKHIDSHGRLYTESAHDIGRDSIVDDLLSVAEIPSSPGKMSYFLIESKQMVGIFLSVWARKELVPHIGHLRVSSVGRGIMGCLRNKGCISISMSLHQTSFCFVCSHLASGEKEGNELKRNADVAEILKSTQFPKICKDPNSRVPERIIEHDRIIWLGDLNYRVALSYDETRVLLEDNDWDTLLEKDQLNIEKEAGRVFSGFNEGRILFAPTYKYSLNSDSYAGETVKSKKKRRTPAWCDRILWHGNGIEQLSYIRGESRFSDHRPVCAVFSVEVEVRNKNINRFRKDFSCAGKRMEFEEDSCIPPRHCLYEF